MPTPTKGARLGGGPAHERLILANLATALFAHGRIRTTEAKARRLRPLAERLITKAKRGDLHARRQVLTVVRDKSVVHQLFAEIGPRYRSRPGGYTRIVKLGLRKGDAAPMALIELVEPQAEEVVAEATAATRRAGRSRAAKATAASTETASAQPTEASSPESGEAGVESGEAAVPSERPEAEPSGASAEASAELAGEAAGEQPSDAGAETASEEHDTASEEQADESPEKR